MTLINLLRHISLKRLRLHKAHTFMSVCGIALGVSAIVSIGIVSRGVVRSFEESITSMAGRASLQITEGEAGFPEAMVERVQAVPGVEHGVPVIENTATLINGESRSIIIIGVDMLQDRHIRDYRVSDETTEIPDPLLFLAKPDSILLSRGLAKEINAHIDQTIRIETVHGLRTLTVRGLLEPEGPAKVMNTSLAVMDIYAAQRAFGKEGRIDRIDVSLRSGENVEAARKRIIAALPEGYAVDSPAVRSAQIERITSNLKRNMSSVGFIVIFIGMYIIYNAVSITVVQRRKEIGVLRAIGITRADVVKLFLSETTILSFMGSVVGIGIGILFARVSLNAVSQNLAIAYQLNLPSTVPLAVTVNDVLTGFFIGILTSSMAALLPSFAAARITPISAIRALPFSAEKFVSKWALMAASALFLLLTVLLMFLYAATKHASPEQAFRIVMTAEFTLLFSVTFALPWILRIFISLFQRFIAPRIGSTSRLAGLNIRKNINRNAVAVGAVFLAIALFTNISNMVHSARSSIMEWLETTSNSDLFVTAGHTFSGHAGKHVPMPVSMRAEIDKIEGVRFTDLYRQVFVPFKGSKILVASIDMRRKTEYSTLMLIDGDFKKIGPRLPGRDKVVVNETLAARHHIKTGDPIILPTPGGPVAFDVVAIAVDYTYEFGSVLMDTSTYQKHWDDGLADMFHVVVQRKQDIPAVREAVLKLYGKRMRLFVLSMDEYLQVARKIIDGIYDIFHSMDILSLAIACLGIIITLLASVLERTREIGIIRSVGALRSQVSRIVLVESIIIGATGGVLGVLTGTIVGWMSVEGFGSGEAGMSIRYLVDYSALARAIILAVVFSALAGLYPARRAAKTNVVEALAYE